MNLLQIRQFIHQQIDLNPDAERFRKSLDQRIQQEYAELCDRRNWSFLWAETSLVLRADVSGAQGTREVTLLGSSPNTRELTVAYAGTFPDDAAGQTWVGPDGQEYTIVGLGTVSFANDRVYLDRAYSSTITGTNAYNWTLRYDRYKLPTDCNQVLKVMSEADDRGKLAWISKEDVEDEFLDRDVTGEPDYLFDDIRDESMAPFSAPSLAAASGGSIPASSKLEFGYTIVSRGIESAMGPTATVTLSGANQTVNVTGLEDLTWDAGTAQDSGRIKRLYYRNLSKRGRWRLIEEIDAATTSTSFDGSVPTTLYKSWYEATTYTAGDSVRTCRAWPTPDADYPVKLRYLKAPAPLIADADVPEIPAPFRRVLPYGVLVKLMSQLGEAGQEKMYQRLHDELLKHLSARHLKNNLPFPRFAVVGSSGRHPRRLWGYSDPVKL